MKICVLTQTANDISEYYKAFFKDIDLFFITFKNRNANAIDYLPASTWSDGRNRLWEEVRGKYDYYLFIDDDLEFFKAKMSVHPLLQYILEVKINKSIDNSYSLCSSGIFFSKLKFYLKEFKPEVLSVRNLNNQLNRNLDQTYLRNNAFVRSLGWFDAQFTLFSNYAAERLLPYDTLISGWASAQILIYLFSHEVFRSKALNIIDLGVNNSFHTGPYVPDYKSNLDCKNMIDSICSATNEKYSDLYNDEYNHVNLFYGSDSILNKVKIPSKTIREDYASNFADTLSGIESFMVNNNLKF